MKKCFTAKKKILKVMRICAVQIIVAIVLSTMAVAHESYAQLLDKRITLELSDVSLEHALQRIEAEAQIRFFYSIDQVNPGSQISIHVNKKKLQTVLDDLFRPIGITYKVHEQESVITLKKETKREVTEPRNEDRSKGPPPTRLDPVTGVVNDAATNEPMAGVNVIIKGTTIGTTTDSEGRFSLEARDDAIIVFSFIGYATIETTVSGRSIIDIVMQEDIKSLKEVVVNAGYWLTTKEKQTGNISKLEGKDVEKQPVTNVLGALQGRIPGLDIIQQTGVPGGNYSVRIRGTNSIANGNDPLYIINGVPYTSSTLSSTATSGAILGSAGRSPLNSINPSDIESIEVLKDADATAIYGSRGANGVILITTKKGTAGATKVDFNFYAGGGRVVNKMDLLNTRQYLDMRYEAFRNDEIDFTDNNIAYAPDLVDWDTTRYTDWQEMLIGNTARFTDAQLSISGGDDNSSFNISGGYHKETSVFPGNTGDERASVHVSLENTSLRNKLKTSLSVDYSSNFTDLVNQDLTRTSLYLPPNAPPVYDEEGNLSWDKWGSTFSYLANPLALLRQRYESTTNALIGRVLLNYEILSNLHLKTSLGYSNTTVESIATNPLSSWNPAETIFGLNATVFSNNAFQNWVVEPQLVWNPKLGLNHFEFLVGGSFLDQRSEGSDIEGVGFASESLMKSLQAASATYVYSSRYSQYRYAALFGRINYSFDERYIVNLTARRDGSSRFGIGNRFANFGAVGVAWNFTNEAFLRNASPILSFGKIRASFGITGNDQLGDYQYLDSYSISSGTYQSSRGLQPSRLSNPEFSWEESKKLEVALELGFVKDRITTSVSLYRTRSSSQLVGYPLPPTTGFNSIQGNFPAVVQNAGIELEATSLNIQHTDVEWSTSFNITIPRNELLEFPGLELSPSYADQYVVGQPLNIRKLYHFIGVNPSTGLYEVEDVDGDGIINDSDRQTLRFVGYDFYGGLSNTVRYKGFELDIMMQFIRQTGQNHLSYMPTPGRLFNQPDLIAGRWIGSGDVTSVQKFSTMSDAQTAYSRYAGSDRGVTDASFVRLKNVSLSYTLPQGWLSKLAVTNLRLFVQGQNLWTLTNYEGLDPHYPGSYLPPLKVFTGGIHLTF